MGYGVVSTSSPPARLNLRDSAVWTSSSLQDRETRGTAACQRRPRVSTLPLHTLRLLVVTQSNEFCVTEMIVPSPLQKLEPANQHWLEPQCRMPDYAACFWTHASGG